MKELAESLIKTGYFNRCLYLENSFDLSLNFDVLNTYVWIHLNFIDNLIRIETTRYKKRNDLYFKFPDEIKNILNFHLDLFK